MILKESKLSSYRIYFAISEPILSATAPGKNESISQYLSRIWDEDPALHAQLWEMNGCLEKVANSILQIERLSNHHNQLLTQAIDATKDLNPIDAVFLASEVSSDFESLLLQSQAALERKTKLHLKTIWQLYG